MIFIDKIEDVIELEKYLYLRLPNCICNGNQVFVVIWFFTFNLDINARIRVIEDFQYGNAQICICTKYASMGINISDIMHAV